MKIYYSSAYYDHKRSELDSTYIVRLMSYLTYLNPALSEILCLYVTYFSPRIWRINLLLPYIVITDRHLHAKVR